MVILVGAISNEVVEVEARLERLPVREMEEVDTMSVITLSRNLFLKGGAIRQS